MTLFMLLVTYSDALDALPLEFTRSFSDLRELDAVLGGEYLLTAHLSSLTVRMQHLAAIIEDTSVTPEQRFVALREAAEEARAYKMGGEDKVRVAVNTAEMVRQCSQIASHTEYIDSLLRSLTSLPMLAPLVHERRARFRRLYELSAATNSEEIPTTMMPVEPIQGLDPVHAHKSMHPPMPRREDPRNKKRKAPVTTSRESSSRSQPPNKRRDPRRGWYDGSDDGSDAQDMPGGRHGSGPESDGPVDVRGRGRVKGGRDDMEDQRYCFCNNVSYGDMIGCDDDECDREWFHLECVGLSKPPQGTWYCDACLERRNVRL